MWRKLLSIFKKVDKVQKQVDGLLGLFRGSNRTTTGDYSPENHYGLSPRQCERLGVKILKLQDGVLSPYAQRRFFKTLQADDGSARYYFDFQELTRMLYVFYRKQTASQYCCAPDFLYDEV